MKRKSEKSDFKNEEDCNFEPKLTRSKAKKLLQSQPNIVWPITPVKPVERDFNFINEDLPEESDDEEYKPSVDDLQEQSEEESGRNSVVSIVSHNSSFDRSVNQYLEKLGVRLMENDFTSVEKKIKVSGENIGQRTRSKLCLSDTPLEAIEKAFVPPDITTDMYDFQCDNEDWENFLKEFMQPLSNDTNNMEDDDEADPEYNALADEEKMYKEELKRDKAVKISRKELRKLMAELFECPDEISSDDDEENIAKLETINKESLEDKLDFKKEEGDQNVITIMTKSQILLLQQQLRQHVQLTTQHFLQTCNHPLFGKNANECKVLMATLLELSKSNKSSIFNIFNLQSAFFLIEKWEKYLLGKNGPHVIKYMEKEVELAKKAKRKGNYHRITFHSSLLKLMSESDVFIYPLLLPPNGFRCDGPLKMEFVSPEDSLIAIGLHEFTEYLKNHPRWFDRIKITEKAACELICEHLMPVKSSKQIIRRIRQVKKIESNPIHFYRLHKKPPRTIHYVIPFNEHLKQPPCARPKEILPEMFRNYLYPEESNENMSFQNLNLKCKFK